MDEKTSFVVVTDLCRVFQRLGFVDASNPNGVSGPDDISMGVVEATNKGSFSSTKLKFEPRTKNLPRLVVVRGI